VYEDLMNDTIDLVKPDGRRIAGIKAVVQPAEIITLNTELEAVQGDRVERTLENGEAEAYQVSGSSIEPAQGAIPAFCRIRVRKETPTGLDTGLRIVFGVAAPEVAVRLFSADSLVVIAHVTAYELFAHLRQAVETGIGEGDEKSRSIAALDALRESYGTPDLARRASDFVALAVDRREVFGPFLVALGQLLAM